MGCPSREESKRRNGFQGEVETAGYANLASRTFLAVRWSIFCQIICLQTQSPAPQSSFFHKRKKYGHQNQDVNGGGDHAADERLGNRFHHIGADAALPQNRNETREHHAYGHEFRPEALHGAFDDGLLNVFMLQRFTAREPPIERFV